MTAEERVLEVLVEHRVKRGVRSMNTHCQCGWTSAAQADGWYEHARHQAQQIVAAQRRKGAKA
jgi:hypothetical protein